MKSFRSDSLRSDRLATIAFVVAVALCIEPAAAFHNRHFYQKLNNSLIENEWNVTCSKKCSCNSTISSNLLEEVQTVDCSFASLRVVPPSVPLEVESLKLSHNNIESLTNELRVFRYLREIDLSSNKLTELAPNQIFLNQTQLRFLDLSSNQLKSLDGGVFAGLRRLKTLVITNGFLKYIDEHAFDGLENLRELDLENNRLNSVYLELFQSIVNLEALNLAGNSIAHLPGGIFTSLGNLVKLDLARNGISRINDNAFAGLDTLEEMHLNENQLARVPSIALQSLKRLRFLDVGSNGFSQLATADVVHIPVEQIFIEKCPHLMLVDRGAFWDLPNVREIHLSSNRKLQFIDAHAFLGVPVLKTLYLHNSSLLTIQEEMANNVINHAYHHQRLQMTLEGNPLLCDCNIRFIVKCLQNETNNRVEILDADKLQCAQPLLSNNLTVTHITELFNSSLPSECEPLILNTVSSNNTFHRKTGESHMFQCRALGFPNPKIHWLLPGGKVLNETSNTVHMQLKTPGVLRLFHLKPRDSGRYTCVAENEMGTSTATMALVVDSVEVQIFPETIEANSALLVWNGTSRNTYPSYLILYKLADEPYAKFDSVAVNHYAHQYSITGLFPDSRYQVCIAIRDHEILSCITLTTKSAEFTMKGIRRNSYAPMLIAVAVSVAMLFIVWLMILAARTYKRRHYETPDKSLVDNMSHIALENIY